MAAEQLAINRLQLHHNTIQPTAPQGWFPPHQIEI
jgi:hypothetical protein